MSARRRRSHVARASGSLARKLHHEGDIYPEPRMRVRFTPTSLVAPGLLRSLCGLLSRRSTRELDAAEREDLAQAQMRATRPVVSGVLLCGAVRCCWRSSRCSNSPA